MFSELILSFGIKSGKKFEFQLRNSEILAL